MYISLKWKLVGFLSLVLITMTFAWTWQSIDKQLDSFHDKLTQMHKEQSTLLSELVSDNLLKLSQFSQLISKKNAVLKSLDDTVDDANLKKSLEEDWIDYNINLGLDYLAVFTENNIAKAEIYSPELQYDHRFRSTIFEELKSRQAFEKPHTFIYCTKACLLVVLEPFINSSGKAGTIALAQNMADIVRVFFNFSKAGLGVLIGGESSVQMRQSERFLTDWRLFAWAISDFDNLYPVIKAYSAQHKLTGQEADFLHTESERVFLIKPMAAPAIQILGATPHFISVNDETADYKQMHNNIIRGIITGILGLLGAEIVLWLLLISPMDKLLNITKALHLLPQQEFLRAASEVKSKTSAFPDELSTLETSTAYVAYELEKLHQEINTKNESLQQQIHALTRSRSFLTRLFDNAQIFIITQDLSFNILSTNKKYEELHHCELNNFTSLFSEPDDVEYFRAEILKLKNREIDVFHQELHQSDKDNEDFVITWTHALVENEKGDEIILSIGIDQTQQKKAEHNLRWMANHDSLTGVGNRRFFNAEFARILESGIHGALAFIDVNRFKQINDIYGHSVGDEVLADIATKLRSLVRSSDVICRFAGDEFIAILTNLESAHLPDILAKLSTRLGGSVKTPNGGNIAYSVSIGAALFPEHGIESQTLIVNADMAMYNAKKKGMGYWHIYNADDEKVVQLKHDHQLIVTIKNALKENTFQLVYQPILNIDSNIVSHHEVLIRMFDEHGEAVSPALFIPVAERSGEIRKIDEWVLDNALAELSSITSNGVEHNFAVNISAPTMQADDFPQLVFSSIKKHNVNPDNLIIELTETAYIENFQQVLRNLKQITEAGVRVALDDFGVGFSSFTYLKMLPLSYVKLDGSYIQHLSQNPEDQVFVKSLAAIIDAYGMETIAEFVEDHDTLLLLAALGVKHGQGYFIGRPGAIETDSLKSLSI